MQNALSLRDRCDRCWGYNVVILFLWRFFIFSAVLGPHCCAGFSSCAERGGPFTEVCGLLAVASLTQHRLEGAGAEAVACRLAGSRAQARVWWCSGLAALRHAGSSQPRDRTGIPRMARQVLNHWAARGAPRLSTWCTPTIAVSTRVSSANPGFCLLTGVHVL